MVFVVVNLVMYAMIKFAAICIQMKKACELFLDLPILLLVRTAFAKVMEWMLDIAKMGKSKDEPRKKEIKEMRSEMKSNMEKMYAIIEGLTKAIPLQQKEAEK